MLQRVLFVLGANQVGGAERQVQQLAHAMSRAGVRVHVAFLERPGRRRGATQLDFGAATTSHLWRLGRTNALARWHLGRLARRFRPDAAFLYNLAAIEVGGGVLRRAWVPLIVASIRGLWFQREADSLERLQAAVRSCHVVSANCTAIAAALEEKGVCRPGTVRVLRNIIELPPGTGSWPAPPAVLFAGSLKPVKDPACFVEACRQLRGAGSASRFLVAGDGPLRAELEQFAARQPAAGIEFLGQLPPERIPWAEATVVASSSQSEGASNSLLEALAHGRPVVATAVGGSVEIIESSGAGELVAPRDAAALADALSGLLADLDRLDTMARKGRDYVAREHSAEAVLAAHHKLADDRDQGWN